MNINNTKIQNENKIWKKRSEEKKMHATVAILISISKLHFILYINIFCSLLWLALGIVFRRRCSLHRIRSISVLCAKKITCNIYCNHNILYQLGPVLLIFVWRYKCKIELNEGSSHSDRNHWMLLLHVQNKYKNRILWFYLKWQDVNFYGRLNIMIQIFLELLLFQNKMFKYQKNE